MRSPGHHSCTVPHVNHIHVSFNICFFWENCFSFIKQRTSTIHAIQCTSYRWILYFYRMIFDLRLIEVDSMTTLLCVGILPFLWQFMVESLHTLWWIFLKKPTRKILLVFHTIHTSSFLGINFGIIWWDSYCVLNFGVIWLNYRDSCQVLWELEI